MTDEPTPRRRRPRAVPEALRGDLGRAADRIAKGWLLELVDAAPLASAPDIAAADLAVEGPDLARAIVAAVGADVELERLAPGGDRAGLAARAGGLAGAVTPAETLAAVDALREVALTQLLGGLRHDETAAAADLAARLAHVGAVVTLAALGGPRGVAPRADSPDRAPEPTASTLETEVVSDADARDELARVRAERSAAGDAPRPAERAEWRDALERLLEQRSAPGRRLALLLVEIDDRERLAASEPDSATAVLDQAGRAIREHVRHADVLVHEEAGRNWVIAPEVGRQGGLVLAERLAATVGWAASLRGTPLTASVGLAVFPEDGRSANALAASAEENLYAARAEGAPVAGGLPGDDDAS